MEIERVGWVLGLLASCGARSDLSPAPLPDAGTSSPSPPANGCTDALAPDAFTPINRYCSDRSRRASAPAPQHPQVAWTQPIGAERAAVDASGRAFVSVTDGAQAGVRAYDLDGTLAWVAPLPFPHPEVFLLADGRVRLTSGGGGDPQLPDSLVTFAADTGSWLGTAPWPPTFAGPIVGSDGGLFTELLRWSPFGFRFDGVARMTVGGDVGWTEKSTCESLGDIPAPYAFARRGDDMLLVCTNHDGTLVHALEVDRNDTVVSEGWAGGMLLSDVVITPTGDAFFFVTQGIGQGMELIGLSPQKAESTLVVDAISQGDGWTTNRMAVARNGTLLFGAKGEFIALRDGQIRWRIPLVRERIYDLLVDSDHTVVVAIDSSVVALDVNDGSKLWELPIWNAALASAGPGKLYAMNELGMSLLTD